MRTFLVWLCLLCAAVATSADFTAVYVPKPGETPLPIPQEELRAEWRYDRVWPPFPLTQGPQWELVFVAGRPLTLVFREGFLELSLSPGKPVSCLVDTRWEPLLRDAEGRLRSLELPPRPVGYPKGTLVCLGQYTSFLPFALYEDSAHLAIEDRAFLPFWLDALLGHPAAKLRDRDPWKLPDPRLYVQAQLRLAPKALGLPEDVPLDTLIQTLKARRAEFDPPPVPEGLFAVSRQGDDHLIFSFTNVTDAPLTVHSLPSVTLCNSRRAFLDSSRGEGVFDPELVAPFTLAPGERRDLPFLLAGKASPSATATLIFSEPVMLGGELRALRLPPIEIHGRWVDALLPRGDAPVLTLTQTLPPGARPAEGDCPLALAFEDADPFDHVGALSLTSCADAPIRVEPAQEAFAVAGFPEASVCLLDRSYRLAPGGVCDIDISEAPLAAALHAPLSLSCNLHVLTEEGTYWTLTAARTYPTADPNTVREALREYYEAWPRPAEPFVPATPTTLDFERQEGVWPDSLPTIDPAWIRLTLEGDALSLTLANPSEAPLSFDAGEFILWDTEDVFRLDGKLVRSPRRNAIGEHLSIPRITLSPGESKTLRWRVTGLAPGKLDRMLYVEAPILIDGEPACIFHTEIPLLDLSGEFLFFDPLPPDNCELLQERESVDPPKAAQPTETLESARFPRKVIFEKRVPGHTGVSALGVSDPCPAGRLRGRV